MARISVPESPAFHRDACETILTIADQQQPLKDSIDHGFRVFPVAMGTVEHEINATELVDEKHENTVIQVIEAFIEILRTVPYSTNYLFKMSVRDIIQANISISYVIPDFKLILISILKSWLKFP